MAKQVLGSGDDVDQARVHSCCFFSTHITQDVINLSHNFADILSMCIVYCIETLIGARVMNIYATNIAGLCIQGFERAE